MAGYIEICEFSLGKIIRWIQGRNFPCDKSETKTPERNNQR